MLNNKLGVVVMPVIPGMRESTGGLGKNSFQTLSEK
jgi:hypothetical protein